MDVVHRRVSVVVAVLAVGLMSCSSGGGSVATTVLPTTTVNPALKAAADCFNEYLIDVSFIEGAVDFETGFRDLALEYGAQSERYHQVVRLANETYGNSFQYGYDVGHQMLSDSIIELCKAAGYDTDLLN